MFRPPPPGLCSLPQEGSSASSPDQGVAGPALRPPPPHVLAPPNVSWNDDGKRDRERQAVATSRPIAAPSSLCQLDRRTEVHRDGLGESPSWSPPPLTSWLVSLCLSPYTRPSLIYQLLPELGLLRELLVPQSPPCPPPKPSLLRPGSSRD